LFRVSQPAVACWERGTKRPQGQHAQRLAELALEHLRDGPAFTPANLVALRRRLNETQRYFGQRIGVSRQTVANWEDRLRKPNPSQLKVFANLATKVTSMADGPITVRKTDLLTVAESAAYLHIAEKTIRNAIKDGRLAYVRDKMPGPWPKDDVDRIRRCSFVRRASCRSRRLLWLRFDTRFDHLQRPKGGVSLLPQIHQVVFSVADPDPIRPSSGDSLVSILVLA
jgi:DNA-binding transcriptional regulator YiaG